MRSLERVRYVTKNYRILQGLRQVPIGIFLLMVAVFKSGFWPWYEGGQAVSFSLAMSLFLPLVLTVGAYALISIYYKRNFGQVRHYPRSERDMILKSLLSLAVIVAFFADVRYVAPVSLVGLTFAILMFAEWLEESRFRPYYLLVSIMLALVSLLPVTGIFTLEQFVDVGLLLSLGIAIFIVGTGDHLILKRFMLPKPKEGSGAVR